MTNSDTSHSITGAKQCFQEAAQASEANTSKKRKRPSPVTLRLTWDERAILERLSQGSSISAYIRTCVFGDGVAPRKRQVRTPVKDQVTLAKILGLLGQTHIANNLNQLAYQANTGSLVMDKKALDQIEETYAYIKSMRSELMHALGLTKT